MRSIIVVCVQERLRDRLSLLHFKFLERLILGSYLIRPYLAVLKALQFSLRRILYELREERIVIPNG